jgi:hypothetical protein
MENSSCKTPFVITKYNAPSGVRAWGMNPDQACTAGAVGEYKNPVGNTCAASVPAAIPVTAIDVILSAANHPVIEQATADKPTVKVARAGVATNVCPALGTHHRQAENGLTGAKKRKSAAEEARSLEIASQIRRLVDIIRPVRDNPWHAGTHAKGTRQLIVEILSAVRPGEALTTRDLWMMIGRGTIGSIRWNLSVLVREGRIETRGLVETGPARGASLWGLRSAS